MMTLAVLERVKQPDASAAMKIERIMGAYDIVQKLIKAEKSSDYQINKLLGYTQKK